MENYIKIIEEYRKTQNNNLLTVFACKSNNAKQPEELRDQNYWPRVRLIKILWENYTAADKPLLKWLIKEEVKAQQECMMPVYALDIAAYMLYKYMDLSDVFDLFFAKFASSNEFYLDIELVFGYNRVETKQYLQTEGADQPYAKDILRTIESYEDALSQGAIYKDRDAYMKYFEERKIKILFNELENAKAFYKE